MMNPIREKKATLNQKGKKTGKGLRSPNFHHSAPNLSEMTKEEAAIHAEKVLKEGAPKATEAQSMETLLLSRPVKLAPLESGLEVKDAQLQRIINLKRDTQPAASKLVNAGSISSEPHVKKVKNLPQVEVEIETAEKATLEHQDQNCPSKASKPTCDVQIILPTQGDPKPPKNPTANGSPIPCPKPVTSQNFQAPDFQESAKIEDSCSQGNGRDRFRLKQKKEQESLGKTQPLQTTGGGVGEGKPKMVGQRAQKTLSDANKLLENIAKKYKGQDDGPDEIDKDLLLRIQSSRRMALGDITLVDED